MPEKELPKNIISIREITVVEVRKRKYELLGFKVYITDAMHQTKFPRKPGDLKGRELPKHGEPLANGYYGGIDSVAAVQQALLDYEIWKEQGYQRYEN